MKQLLHYFLLAATCITVGLSGCKKDDLQVNSPNDSFDVQNGSKKKSNFSNEVATGWFDLELGLIKTTGGFSPPVASRALGYTGITLYESIVAGMDGYSSLKSKFAYTYTLPGVNAGTQYHWPAVANAALKSMVSSLFASANAANKAAIENLYNKFHQQHLSETSSADVYASEAYGRMVAEVIFEWSKTDGGHQGYLNNTPAFTLPTFAGAWVPTAPAYQATPVQAYWGNNRPFISGSLDINCVPPPPPFAFSTSQNSEFYKQAYEVYTTSKQLTQEQKDIANFWGDGGGTVTPPGHYISIATQMIKVNNQTLNDAAVTYAKMGMAVADAFIACWKGKFTYNLMRPITYIKQNIDPSWSSLLVTPPFPSYASGHATVSGAAAEVLTDLYGHKKFTDRTHEQLYGVRDFKNFYEAAEEAAVSRLYGGIHYRMDNEIGMEKGKLIGKNIAKIKFKK